MQSMSHYYKVIVHRAYCMDTEYAIKMLIVKIVKKSFPQGIYRAFNLPQFKKIVISIS